VHICQDEIYLFLMALPFLGGIIAWVKNKLHRNHKHCHEEELKKKAEKLEQELGV
jgi:hypothetical protein